MGERGRAKETLGLFGGIKRYLFSYDAVEETGRRRARRAALQSEDRELTKTQRGKLVSNTRDLARNMSIPAWAIRKHLDYVSTFSFQCRTGNRELDDRIESLMEWWSRPVNFDVAARHSLHRFIRMAEERRTIDGDYVIAKLDDGRVQGIESDRIRTPDLLNQEQKLQIVEGIEVDPFGRALAYHVCDRGGRANELIQKARIPAAFAYHFGYFTRTDQVRGISPLASAINTFSDIYESAEYALAKAKVSQLFGLKFTRSGDQPLTGDDNSAEPYQFSFGKGPQLLDLDVGDNAEFMESKTPSTEFAAYCEKMTAVALKSLDIPYSFFAENFTNYSGARQALLQYEQSAQAKRHDVKQLLNQLTAWRLSLFIQDGYLELPKGMLLGDVRWEWIPSGMPWIDPLKEINADIAAIGAGLSSRQEICKSRGKDFFEVADQLAAEQSYLQERGLRGDSVVTEIEEEEKDESKPN